MILNITCKPAFCLPSELGTVKILNGGKVAMQLKEKNSDVLFVA